MSDKGLVLQNSKRLPKYYEAVAIVIYFNTNNMGHIVVALI